MTGQVFQGTHYLYAISLPSGDVVHSLQHHTVQYKEGDAVDVRFEANQTLTCFVDESEPPLESGWSFSAVTAGEAVTLGPGPAARSQSRHPVHQLHIETASHQSGQLVILVIPGQRNRGAFRSHW